MSTFTDPLAEIAKAVHVLVADEQVLQRFRMQVGSYLSALESFLRQRTEWEDGLHESVKVARRSPKLRNPTHRPSFTHIWHQTIYATKRTGKTAIADGKGRPRWISTPGPHGAWIEPPPPQPRDPRNRLWLAHDYALLAKLHDELMAGPGPAQRIVEDSATDGDSLESTARRTGAWEGTGIGGNQDQVEARYRAALARVRRDVQSREVLVIPKPCLAGEVLAWVGGLATTASNWHVMGKLAEVRKQTLDQRRTWADLAHKSGTIDAGMASDPYAALASPHYANDLDEVWESGLEASGGLRASVRLAISRIPLSDRESAQASDLIALADRADLAFAACERAMHSPTEVLESHADALRKLFDDASKMQQQLRADLEVAAHSDTSNSGKADDSTGPLPDPVSNANLAKRAGCHDADNMSRAIKDALRAAGQAVHRVSKGKRRRWSRAQLSAAFSYLPDGKLKFYLTKSGFGQPEQT